MAKQLIMILFFVGKLVFAQATDSLVYAEGNIINAETRQPVSAKITYKSLPYGNKIGVINNATSYSFPMFDGNKYSIIVEAAGYVPVRYTLDPTTANNNLRVVQHIELIKGSYNLHEVGQVMTLKDLIFQVGKSKISSESYPELDLVVKMMQEHHNMVIQLEGHTDYRGDPKENLKLSQQRVDAVKKYLVSKSIHKNRIRTVAFGGSVPLSRENTQEAHRMNRRVELRILEK